MHEWTRKFIVIVIVGSTLTECTLSAAGSFVCKMQNGFFVDSVLSVFMASFLSVERRPLITEFSFEKIESG